MKYESSINGYSFLMDGDDRIEVWENSNVASPLCYINVDAGSIRSEKDFHVEISHWFIEKLRNEY
jgi:hypothetical protein